MEVKVKGRIRQGRRSDEITNGSVFLKGFHLESEDIRETIVITTKIFHPESTITRDVAEGKILADQTSERCDVVC